MTSKYFSKKSIRLFATVISATIVLCGIIFGANWIHKTYVRYVQSRSEKHVIADPFSQKLFDIDAEKIKRIKLFGKYTKTSDEIRRVRTIGNAVLDSGECIEELVAVLNSFEFTFVIPDPYEGRGTASIHLFYGDSERLIIHYRNNVVGLNGFWYYGDRVFFEKLCAIGEKYARYSGIGPAPVY